MTQWETENKLRPGAYINFESTEFENNSVAGSNIAAVLIAGAWDGTEKEFELVNSKTDFYSKFGKELDELLAIRETLKGTNNVLVYNALFGKGTEAKVTDSDCTITANKKGSAGNNIKVIFTKNLDETFDIVTTIKGITVDEAQDVSNLKPFENEYVTVESYPTGDVVMTLEGGTDEEVTNRDYEEFLKKLDTQEFKTIALPTTDTTLQNMLKTAIKSWRKIGRTPIGVTASFATDYEGIVSVANGVTLPDGELKEADAVYYAAGAYAGAGVKSNTYSIYPGAIDCERKTNNEINELILKGQLVYTFKHGNVVIETDINTLTTFSEKKNRQFRKNKLIRIQDIVNDSVKRLFETDFIGKVVNNKDGQESFLEKIITSILDPLKEQNAIDYVPDELEVAPGKDTDAILVTIPIILMDAMEKAYITVICK